MPELQEAVPEAAPGNPSDNWGFEEPANRRSSHMSATANFKDHGKTLWDNGVNYYIGMLQEFDLPLAAEAMGRLVNELEEANERNPNHMHYLRMYRIITRFFSTAISYDTAMRAEGERNPEEYYPRPNRERPYQGLLNPVQLKGPMNYAALRDQYRQPGYLPQVQQARSQAATPGDDLAVLLAKGANLLSKFLKS